MVGRNGSGKSILLQILAGKKTPSAGRVLTDDSVGYLSQERDHNTESVASFLGYAAWKQVQLRMQTGLSTQADFDYLEGRWDFEEKLNAALHDFSLSRQLLSHSLASLSAGEYTKIRLIELSWRKFQITILDEPTNHLDQLGKKQLLNWIQQQSCVIVASHDISILNHANQILELQHGKLTHTQCDWAGFLNIKANQQRNLEHQEHIYKKEMTSAKKQQRRVQEHLDKQLRKGKDSRQNSNQSKIILNHAKSKSEASHSRLKSIQQDKVDINQNRLRQIQQQKIEEAPIYFHMDKCETKTGVAVMAQDLCLHHVDSLPLNFQIQHGQRFAITGRNGSGKSTLMKVITHHLEQASGDIQVYGRYKMLDQHFSLLEKGANAIENMALFHEDLSQTEVRQVLAHLRLKNERISLPVQRLSSGEQLKLALACLFSGRSLPNILCIDEPDNHLDMESKKQLVKTLQDYPGTLVVISHDDDFLQQLNIEAFFDLDDHLIEKNAE
ncbi:MAG: ABC-F family ATP-binding cassette domain-containing protein [Shewanellaceae bacterium]|nr:ABC-F family ATP-binding cassette domain-containing protein [Shewanellaceae bacterium]